MGLHHAIPRIPADNPALYRDCDADAALLADIARINQGWSCNRAVIDRAKAIREALRDGRDDDAEALACEIDTLQMAADRLSGIKAKAADWTICTALWAEMLIGGACRLSRHFSTPWATDASSALSEARRIFCHTDRERAAITVAPRIQEHLIERAA